MKSTVQASITVKKGALIKVVVKDSTGKSFTIASLTAKSTGTYKTPALKFAKAGSYQVTILIGKVKKVITYKITK
jgi:ribosome-binding factor A